MEAIVHVTRPASRVGWTTLYAIGDVHVGNRESAKAHFKRDIERVRADEGAEVVLMGDLIEGIPKGDRRFAAEDVDPEFLGGGLDRIIQAQVEWVIDALTPIRDRIICAVMGNHEMAARKVSRSIGIEYDPHYEICRGLGCRSLDYCGWIVWKFREPEGTQGKWTDTVRVFAHHGYGGGRTEGGHALALKAALDMVTADLFLMGHRHQAMALSKVRLDVYSRGDTATPIERVMTAAHTGSYLRVGTRGPANYAARAGYPPVALGMRRIHIQPYPSSGRRPYIEVVV